MAEGKTLGVPGVTCEFCEEADAIKFCIECNQPMCGQCTKIHGKVASSKTHNFIPIEDYKLFTSSAKADISQAYCAKHQQKIIDKLCEDCLVVVCTECESDHTGHKLNNGNFDANFLHRVCAQKVPGLLEILQELKDLEDGSPEKIRLYKEAEKLVKSWKDQLLDLINKDADRLLGEIRDEIKKHEQILTDTSSKTKEYIVKADHQITKMSESRKISNTAKLLDQMSKCDKDVEDIKTYIEGVKSSHAKQTINDILPYKDDFQQAVNTLKNQFTKTHQCLLTMSVAMSAKGKHRRLIKAYNKLGLANETSLPSENFCFSLGQTCLQMHTQILVYEATGTKIHIYDRSLNNTKSCTFKEKIFRLLIVNHNRYVIIELNKRNVYLTNENFEILNTIAKPDSGYQPHGLCPVGVDQCVISEVNKSKKIRLREIRFSGNSASSEILCNIIVDAHYNGLISNHDSGHVTLTVSATKLCTVNPITGGMETAHTTSLDAYTSMCGDGENVLVGTYGGCVYKVIPREKSCVLLQGLESVWGLQVTDSEVLVLSGNKLQIYKPQ